MMLSSTEYAQAANLDKKYPILTHAWYSTIYCIKNNNKTYFGTNMHIQYTGSGSKWESDLTFVIRLPVGSSSKQYRVI